MPPRTIAAIATPLGRGAVAIVRVSGPGARRVAAAVFRGPNLRARYATLGSIVGPDGVPIDRGLALFFPGPASYTGDDVLELHLHGSVAVARQALLAVLAAGAELAEPGEFTRRAFLAGKLDLSAAEAVAELIDAERRGDARAAAARLAGGLATEVERLRGALGEIAERLAAALDFPDEVEAPTAGELGETISRVDRALAELADTWEHGRIVREGVAVAVVGPPNAGKSSLVNALLESDRVLVSPVAGTTRDTVEETLALGDGRVVRLIDTAGLRAASDPVEAAGVVRAEAALAQATVALVVVDGSALPDRAALDVLARTRGRERVVYFSKRDLGRAGFDAREPFEGNALFGSVTDRTAIDALRAELAVRIDTVPGDVARPALGTARQADAVLSARRFLGDARATIDAGEPIDLAAPALVCAGAALGALTGRDASEALLDAVFARFCIGK